MGLTNESDPTSWDDGMDWSAPDPANPRYWRALCLALRERWQAAALAVSRPSRALPASEYPMRGDVPSADLLRDIAAAIRAMAPCFLDMPATIARCLARDLPPDTSAFRAERMTWRKIIAAAPAIDTLPPLHAMLRDPLVAEWMSAAKNALGLLRYTEVPRNGCLRHVGIDPDGPGYTHAAGYYGPTVAQALAANCTDLPGGANHGIDRGYPSASAGGAFGAYCHLVAYWDRLTPDVPWRIAYTGTTTHRDPISWISACDVRLFNVWPHSVDFRAACSARPDSMPAAVSRAFDGFGSGFRIGDNSIALAVAPGEAATAWTSSAVAPPSMPAAPDPPSPDDDPDAYTESVAECLWIPYADHATTGGFRFQ